MTIAELLTRNYDSLTVYIYNEEDKDEYKFFATVYRDNVMFDGDEITLEVFDRLSHMEIVLPLPDSGIKWNEESESYEYIVGDSRYELFF